MLDPKYIRDHRDVVAESIKARGLHIDLDEWFDLYAQRIDTLKQVEQINHRRKELAGGKKQVHDSDRSRIAEYGKQLKSDLALYESRLHEIEEKYTAVLHAIPNLLHADVPVGACEDDNREIKRWGISRVFDFAARDHIALARDLDLVEFERAATVSGPKFYYLKNEAVILEQALIRYALDIIHRRGFTLYTTPDVAKQDIAASLGFSPRGKGSNSYRIEDTPLCLIATSEITLGGYYAKQKIDSKALPVRMGGISHCFRREAGAAGKAGRGLYRVHQFTKVEMFIICAPEHSEELHAELLDIEEEIFQGLEIPYRIVEACSAELGAPAYRKFDIEAWMPGRVSDAHDDPHASGGWGEVTSVSNCTDYQARRLHIRTHDGNNNACFAHMLNGTAIATTRAIIALLENGQQADGSVRLPKSLHRYTGFDSISPPTE